MKILICTLNSKYIHSCLAPWCLLSACRAYCKETISLKVLEGTVNENRDKLFEKIAEEKADAVTFSCYIWNIEKTLCLCRKIKSASPDTVIILGGPEVAYNQKEILRNNSCVDFVISGEGEIVLPQLLDALSGGFSPSGLDAVSFIDKGELVVKNEITGEAFDYPSPYTEEYFAALRGRIAYIESSRGCPFNCAYCLSGRCGKVRYRSLDETKREILLLAASGTKTVKFIDRTFNCDNNRAVELLRFIRKNIGTLIPEGVCFHFEINADILKSSFIDEVALFPEGTVQFEVGIQSTNKKTLEAIGRKCNKERLFKNIRSLVDIGNCHIHTDLIAGLPFETDESFTNSFNECYFLGANMLQLGFLKLLHGSPLRKGECFCEFSSEAPYEVISTPTMSKADLERLHIAEKELDRLYNSGRFPRTLKYLLETTGFTPFELFCFVGERLPDTPLHLDRYTDEIYGMFASYKNIDAEMLRDCMLYDRIASNNSGIIPHSLYREDRRLREVKEILAEFFPTDKGVNRCLGILYADKTVIFSDYIKKNPVTGEYGVKELPFSFFGETFFGFDIDK